MATTTHRDPGTPSPLQNIGAPPSYAAVLPGLGLHPDEVPALLAAEAFSLARIDTARLCLGALDQTHASTTAVFALGSLGRLEASAQSDLDLAFLYDGGHLSPAAAEARRDRVIAALRPEFDIPEKTFDRAIDLRTITRNIGGRSDTNQALTYRALLLTEGAELSGAARSMKTAVFHAYASGIITRGRFLTSLGNDLHRYYRTLCMDYRHKVEELDKGWALRVLKLRHSRKLWHLANIALQCWAVDAIPDDATRDDALAEHSRWPSLLRLDLALAHFGAAELGREAFLCLEVFLAALASADHREALAGLPYADRSRSPIYAELHVNADRLDAATADIVKVLFERCQRFMVRFCIL